MKCFDAFSHCVKVNIVLCISFLAFSLIIVKSNMFLLCIGLEKETSLKSLVMGISRPLLQL